MLVGTVDGQVAIADFADLADFIVVHPVEVKAHRELIQLDWQTDWVSITDTYDLILAQQFEQNLWGDVSSWFNNLVESGQLWALLIGIIVGYIFRGLTSFG